MLGARLVLVVTALTLAGCSASVDSPGTQRTVLLAPDFIAAAAAGADRRPAGQVAPPPAARRARGLRARGARARGRRRPARHGLAPAPVRRGAASSVRDVVEPQLR